MPTLLSDTERKECRQEAAIALRNLVLPAFTVPCDPITAAEREHCWKVVMDAIDCLLGDYGEEPDIGDIEWDINREVENAVSSVIRRWKEDNRR